MIFAGNVFTVSIDIIKKKARVVPFSIKLRPFRIRSLNTIMTTITVKTSSYKSAFAFKTFQLAQFVNVGEFSWC